MTGEKSGVAIRRRRALRSGLAAIFAAASGLFFVGYLSVPPLGVLDTLPIGRLAGLSLFGMSLWLGWKPGKETWFGDQRIYVNEPEVNDDWKY